MSQYFTMFFKHKRPINCIIVLINFWRMYTEKSQKLISSKMYNFWKKKYYASFCVCEYPLTNPLFALTHVLIEWGTGVQRHISL